MCAETGVEARLLLVASLPAGAGAAGAPAALRAARAGLVAGGLGAAIGLGGRRGRGLGLVRGLGGLDEAVAAHAAGEAEGRDETEGGTLGAGHHGASPSRGLCALGYSNETNKKIPLRQGGRLERVSSYVVDL